MLHNMVFGLYPQHTTMFTGRIIIYIKSSPIKIFEIKSYLTKNYNDWQSFWQEYHILYINRNHITH